MQGDPTPILISNSFAFGAKDFNLKKAYKYMIQGAMIHDYILKIKKLDLI